MTNEQNQVKYSWQIFIFEWSHLRILSIDSSWVRTSLYREEFWACGPLKGSYVFTRTHTDYAIPWSMAVLFSAWFSMSFENHSLNSSCESNSVGIMKWSKAHSCQWEQAKAVRKTLKRLHQVLYKSHKPLPYCSEWAFQSIEVCSYTRSQGESSNARCKMKKQIVENYCKMHDFMSITRCITGS